MNDRPQTSGATNEQKGLGYETDEIQTYCIVFAKQNLLVVADTLSQSPQKLC